MGAQLSLKAALPLAERIWQRHIAVVMQGPVAQHVVRSWRPLEMALIGLQYSMFGSQKNFEDVTLTM